MKCFIFRSHEKSLEHEVYNNLGQSICKLFHFLAQFFFTTSEAELDYYQPKVNVRVVSRVAERLKIGS